MNYQEFISHLTECMQLHLGNSANIQVKQIHKNNGKILDGMIINEGLNIAPTIYMNPYYHRYLDGVSLSDIEEDFISSFEACRPKASVDFSFYTDFDKIKERIIFKLINFDMNKELLEEIPYVKYLDLAIVFQYLVDNECNNFSSILIHNDHMEKWNVTENDLYQLALINTPILLPSDTKPIQSYMMNYYIENGDNDELGKHIMNSPTMYVSTNSAALHGATCILYPNYLKSIAKIFNSDYYVIPCSIHETIFIPIDDTINSLELSTLSAFIKEVNENEVIDEEILSNHAYYYSKEKELLVG